MTIYPGSGMPAWTGLSKHKKRQLGLLVIVGILALIAIGSVLIRPSDPYRRVALAIEKQIKWVNILNVFHSDFEGEHYLETIADIPMFQNPDKIMELHEVIYDEMLKVLDGKEDYLTILFVFGDKDDIRYRASLSVYLDAEYFGYAFDPFIWEPSPQDFPLKPEYVKWEKK